MYFEEFCLANAEDGLAARGRARRGGAAIAPGIGLLLEVQSEGAVSQLVGCNFECGVSIGHVRDRFECLGLSGLSSIPYSVSTRQDTWRPIGRLNRPPDLAFTEGACWHSPC